MITDQMVKAGVSAFVSNAHHGRYAAMEQALIAALGDAGWQDISTAPDDGTRILATGGGLGDEVDIVSYNQSIGAWNATQWTLDDRDDEPNGYSRPKLWQPLPASTVTRHDGGAATSEVAK